MCVMLWWCLYGFGGSGVSWLLGLSGLCVCMFVLVCGFFLLNGWCCGVVVGGGILLFRFCFKWWYFWLVSMWFLVVVLDVM